MDASNNPNSNYYDAFSFNSATLDSNGFVDVVYGDDDTGNLKFTQCANAACSLANVTIMAPADGGFNFYGSGCHKS